MKAEDLYLRFVRWSDADDAYVGFCPDLFPAGGVCHATTEEDAYAELCELVREEVAELSRAHKHLPEVSTRAMRDAIPLD